MQKKKKLYFNSNLRLNGIFSSLANGFIYDPKIKNDQIN